MLPYVGLRVVNWALENKLGDYYGHIEDFDLALWRGSYQLQELMIRKKDSKMPPILTAKEIDLQIAWKPLFHREVAAHVMLDELVLQFFDSKDKSKQQLNMEEKKGKAEEKPAWKSALGIIIPMSVESLKVKNSSIYFTNNDLGKPLPVKLEKIELTAEDLRSRPADSQQSLSPFRGDALLQNHAKVHIRGRYDALASKLRGDLDMQINDFNVNTLNGLLISYVPLDVTEGKLNVYGEAAMSQGRAKGYVNLFLKDGDIIAPKQDFKSLKHFGYEIVAAFANWILKNKKTGEIASSIPFERKDEKWNINGSEAFWSAVHHRKEEIDKGIKKSITLKDVEGNGKGVDTEIRVR